MANAWASSSVMLALTLGILCFAFAIGSAIRGRSRVSGLEPWVACTIFIWLGYHLSPIIALISGREWQNFMLSTQYIEHSLWMSLACIIAFFVGSIVVSPEDARNSWALQSWKDRSFAIYQHSKMFKEWHVWFVAVVVFLISIFTLGGWDELWVSSHTRGYGQWDAHTFDVKVKRFFGVLLPLLSLVLVSVTALLSVSNTSSQTRWLTILVGLLVTGLNAMHGFSRSAGIGFVCLAVLRLSLLGRRDIKVVLGLLLIGFWASYVGYNYRGEYRPGIYSYGEAFIRSLTELPDLQSSTETIAFSLTPNDNFISANEAYTGTIDFVNREGVKPFSDFGAFVYNLHPFPNGIIGIANRGVELSDVFRTRGSIGLTTPTLADLYSSFGNFTPLIFLLLGVLFKCLHLKSREFGPTTEIFVLLFLLLSWPISLHSAFRSQWRIINLVIIGLVLLAVLRRTRQHNRIASTPMKPRLPSKTAKFSR
jgi:hypothetical protein